MGTFTFKTKSQLAYDYLKKSIIMGKIKPRNKIMINSVAKELGISDTPVREALKQLSSEGFVVVQAHVGAIVSDISIDFVKELFQISAVLEALAVKAGLPYIKEETIEKLESYIEKLSLCVEKYDIKNYYRLNNEFHALLIASNPYKYLQKMFLDIRAKLERFRADCNYMPYSMKNSLKEHINILAALKEKNPESLEAAVKEHELSSMRYLVGYYEANNGWEG